MKKRFITHFLIWVCISSGLLFMTGCKDTGTSPQVAISYDFYVDAVSGSDADDGSMGTPFKTLTYAASNAGTDVTIKVLPGTYDTANGETFPITLQTGQKFTGDRANKGDGSTDTLVSGDATAPDGSTCTFVGAQDTLISGLMIQDSDSSTGYSGVFIDDITMEVSNDTFSSGYRGVYAENSGDSVIRNNDFQNSSYCVYLLQCSGSIAIQSNSMTGGTALPIVVSGANSGTLISDNTITGNGMLGIQLEAGNPQIVGNTFNKSTGYSLGAISLNNSVSPKIRNNIFQCTDAILLRTSGGSPTPDLGTSGDPGGNIFTAVTGNSIEVEIEGTTTVYAIGNTFPNAPPTSGSSGDIYNQGTGSVYYTASAFY